jgi:hypothetical protein
MLIAEELRALNRHDVRPPRAVRKSIFRLRLWQPARQRLHSQRLGRADSVRPARAGSTSAGSFGFVFGCVNACCVGNKAATLSRAVVDEQLDIFVVTETWHEDSQSTTLKRITPPGYRCIDAARPIPPDAAVHAADFQNHGGLAFVYREAIKFEKRSLDITVATFEYLFGYASTGASHFVLLGVYRPGSHAPTVAFHDELSAVFERIAAYRCPVVVCGDFNVHVDQCNDPHAARLAQLLQTFGLTQHVTEPTHDGGHTLDLVITRSDTDILNIRVGDKISDHALICFTLPVKKPNTETQWITSRAWRRLSHDAFASDLAASGLCTHLDALDSMSVDELADLYRSVLTSLLDKHCPVVNVRRKVKISTPWFDADCRAARRRARAAERRYKRRRSEADRQAWAEQLKTMHSVYEGKNDSYWRDEIAASKGNMKRLWRSLTGVLGEVTTEESSDHTAEEFATFFTDKVESVRASTATTPLHDIAYRSTPTLDAWTAVTVDEVEKSIGSALKKTCELDPAPTWLVKDMRALLSPFVAILFNTSLATGCFPSEFKQAIVRPLLKKSGLDASQMKNYRPVSNLSFLSKLLERIVQTRLQAFLDSNDMMPTTQSAYRPFHSTETALTKVYNDLLLAVDGGQVSALCLLDLTAAFDTVDHDLLLLRLEREFGLRGITLSWFRSYLTGRTFRVVYGGHTSSTIYIVCSVPQGSVLGPRLFILYTAGLADVAAKHGVAMHMYADDTQLYLHCRINDTVSAIVRLERCIIDIRHWTSANRLKLNMDKTELLWAGSRHGHLSLGDRGPALQLAADTVAACNDVRVLGVTMSSDLGLDKHVSTVSAACFHRLRQLRRVRRSLDTESAATLVHAFVTSRIDYCNSLLAEAPRATTDKLQRVLNAAARVVSGTRKYDHGLSRLLHTELHWLDIPERVKYKLAVMVHRCLHGQAPQYLMEYCTPVSDIATRRHLRSASRHLLTVPRYRLSTYGRRAFCVAGPTNWNSLPDELRDPALSIGLFRRSLKTFLFTRY